MEEPYRRGVLKRGDKGRNREKQWREDGRGRKPIGEARFKKKFYPGVAGPQAGGRASATAIKY